MSGRNSGRTPTDGANSSKAGRMGLGVGTQGLVSDEFVPGVVSDWQGALCRTSTPSGANPRAAGRPGKVAGAVAVPRGDWSRPRTGCPTLLQLQILREMNRPVVPVRPINHNLDEVTPAGTSADGSSHSTFPSTQAGPGLRTVSASPPTPDSAGPTDSALVVETHYRAQVEELFVGFNPLDPAASRIAVKVAQNPSLLKSATLRERSLLVDALLSGWLDDEDSRALVTVLVFGNEREETRALVEKCGGEHLLEASLEPDYYATILDALSAGDEIVSAA